MIGVVVAAAGCGGSPVREPATPATAAGTPQAVSRTVPQQAQSDGTAPGTLIFFRRYRYAGATVKKLTIDRSGGVSIDLPSGGAGRAAKRGRLTPAGLRRVRAAIAAVPWGELSRREVRLDGSGGYYLITRGRDDVTAMASGMSADLIGLVKRLNRIIDSPANTSTFRFYGSP